MRDLGARSIEVYVTNFTRGDLDIVQAELGPTGGEWIDGEAPTAFGRLDRGSALKFGVASRNAGDFPSAQVHLAGVGAYPIIVSFFNGTDDTAGCHVNGNEQVDTHVTQDHNAEPEHAAFTVELVPR